MSKNNIQGFTIVEVLLATVVLGVVVMITSTMLIQTFDLFQRSSERVSQSQLTEIMLTDIKENLRKVSFEDSSNNYNNGEKWIFYTEDPNEANNPEISLKIEIDNGNLILKDNGTIRTLNNIIEDEFKFEKTENRFFIEIKALDNEGTPITKQTSVTSRNL